MNQQITKKQHFVPQFYLRNFSAVDGKLCVYDKINRKYFESNPKSICYEEYLYETPWENNGQKLEKYILQNQIENDFSKSEGTYSALIKKIINICCDPRNRSALICNKDENRTLASFAINMLLRNPWSLDQAEVDSVQNELLKNEEIQTIHQLLQFTKLGDINSLIRVANKRIWLDEGFAGGAPEQLINSLLNLSCSFLVSKDHQFVTSDFPVLYEICETVGGDSEFKTIYLPINTYCMLHYSDNSMAKTNGNKMISISNDVVDNINQFYLKSDINRLIIASKESILRHIAESN